MEACTLFDQRPDRIDQIILAVSVLGAAVFGSALGQDEMLMRWFGPHSGGGEVIGEVTTTHNDVRRRMNRSLGWYNISGKEKIYQRDTFFAGSDSDVAFKLKGRDEFTLSPNSLVVLDLKGNDVFIDLREGSIDSHVLSSDGVKLLLNQQVVVLKSSPANSSVHITKNNHGDVDVVNEDGDVDMQIDGNRISAKKNEVFKIDRNLKVKKRELSVTMTSFHQNDTLWLNQDQPVHFAWKQKDPQLKLRLQISKLHSPDSTVYDSEVSGLETDWHPNETDQSYTYRFIDRESGDTVSTMYTLAVLSRVPLQPLTPAKGENVYKDVTFTATDKKPVKFLWEKKIGVKGYRLVVSHNHDLSLPEIDKKVFTNADTNPLSGGDYFWQIANLEDPHLESDISDFSVGYVDMAPAAAQPVKVTDLKPDISNSVPEVRAENQKILLNFKPPTNGRDIASSANLTNPPALNWQPLDGAKDYKVEISQSETFEDPIVYDSISDPHFSWQNAKPGTYYWRTQARDDDGKMSKTSPPGKLVLGLVPPQIDTPKVDDDTVSDPAKLSSEKPLTVHWQSLPYAAGYKVVTGDKTEIVKTPEYNMNLKPGSENEIRVAAVDRRGRNLSPFSDEKIKFERKLALRTPQSIAPSDHVTIVQFAQGDPTPMIYRWSESPGAKEYEIQLAQDADFKNVLGTKKTTKNQLVVKKSPASGTIFWHVRSIYGDTVSEWSPPSSYDLQVSKEKPED
jgi:hypothetical protein